jgi:uncharacterized protein YjbI with pentapeptide repeats
MDASELLERYAAGERNFRGVDLAGADLSHADLHSANLFDANLRRANLSAANLSKANLRDACLNYADLKGANLRGANLSNASFFNPDLGELFTIQDLRELATILDEACLEGANLAGANLIGASLEGANLSKARMVSSSPRFLLVARFNGANLKKANLSESHCEGVNFMDANLSGAKLHNAYLVRANLARAKLNEADLTNVNLTDANLAGVDLTYTLLKGAKLDGTISYCQNNLGNLNRTNQVLTARVNFLESQLEEQGEIQASNQGTNNAPYSWQGLYFRSKAEIKIAEVLDCAGVLFYPNCKARLNTPEGRDQKESDFLVFYQGKWGILEVDGEPWHTPSRTVHDHERDRLFKAHGICIVEHYDATRCWNEPDGVVREFLDILSQA